VSRDPRDLVLPVATYGFVALLLLPVLLPFFI
jgi:hypothetical protein